MGTFRDGEEAARRVAEIKNRRNGQSFAAVSGHSRVFGEVLPVNAESSHDFAPIEDEGICLRPFTPAKRDRRAGMRSVSAAQETFDLGERQ